MFCKHCGEEVEDEAVVCVHCGKMLKEIKQETPVNKNYNDSKTGIGILMALFLGLIGLIIGIALYPSGTVARTTFIKAWCLTYLVVLLITFLLFPVILGMILPTM